MQKKKKKKGLCAIYFVENDLNNYNIRPFDHLIKYGCSRRKTENVQMCSKWLRIPLT